MLPASFCLGFGWCLPDSKKRPPEGDRQGACYCDQRGNPPPSMAMPLRMTSAFWNTKVLISKLC